MSNRTPSEALTELVSALNATNWSSWQTTAKFDPALAVAQVVIDRERVRDAAPDLLDALREIEAGTYDKWTNGYHAQQVARAAIAKATGQ